MELFSTTRARFAANGLLAVEICFGTLAFWSHAFELGTWQHYLVAALLTATFGFTALLASGVVIRAVSAGAAGASVTVGLVAFCGVVLFLVGAGMTWHGLSWADQQAELIPGQALDWLLIPAASLLSGLNFVAIYVFCRELKPAARQPQLVDFDAQAKNPHAQAMAHKSWESRRKA